MNGLVQGWVRRWIAALAVLLCIVYIAASPGAQPRSIRLPENAAARWHCARSRLTAALQQLRDAPDRLQETRIGGEQ